MKRIETELPGVYIIQPQVFGDHRGYFMETYNIQSFHEMGIETVFIQDNQSFTAKKGTVRGIHFPESPDGTDQTSTCDAWCCDGYSS